MICCERPEVVRMDHKVGTVIDYVQVVNRMCRRCGRHWYGPEGAVKEYTRQQWDAWINEEAA